MPNKDEVIQLVIEAALVDAQQRGLEIGQVVAHQTEKPSGILSEINGKLATVQFGTEHKTFPLDELFDPQYVMEKAMAIYAASGGK